MIDQEALPGMEDDTPPAEPFIRQLLKDALISQDMAKIPALEDVQACKTNAEVAALYHPWNAATYSFLFHAVTAHLLIRIKDTSPNLAAGLAREVRDWLDAGDAYPEWVWDWATAAGIDPQKTIDEARVLQTEWLAKERPFAPDS